MATAKRNSEDLFHEAMEIADKAERKAYLDEACQDDPPLRAEVEALLMAHDRAGEFLQNPAGGSDVTLDLSASREAPGTRIGHYELLELVGEGGMGLVYLADQKEPVKRRVALKIIKPGMDSKQVIARFEAERQALALLDHPNVAHVLDAGTTPTGHPYFVMEYVKGVSITRYCDEHKLSIEQRLRLFELVCEAVHHAHQKGIIHRDLKPSNILVSLCDDRAVPKIIDFGIAKAVSQPLTDKTFVTFQGELLGTPEYMSPEQVDLATQDVDTRSDIYSLGVVLYELLAGVLPLESECFTKVGLAEIQRTIREVEPASPSVRLTQIGDKAGDIADRRGTQVAPLARRLHRELEWIPLKAMRKDRCRRYKSASDMADDLRNYLDGNPLIAGPETVIYRVQKFVHRHAGSVATAAVVAAAIVLGLIVSTILYLRAEAMRRDAEAARAQEATARSRAEQAEMATQQKAEELRRALYTSAIQLADAKYRDGNIRHVRELLEACPGDLRGWEWNRLNHVMDQSVMTLRGHDSVVHSLDISPDGKRIVSAAHDATVRIWDAETGIQLAQFQDKSGDASCLTYSPDGKHIASGGLDGKVRIWDALTGKERRVLSGHADAVRSVAFSPDGARIASGDNAGAIRVWDAATGLELKVLRGHEMYIRSVVYSPGGHRLLSAASGGQAKVWDAATGSEMMVLDGASRASFSPDGKYIAGAGNNEVKLWDASTGNPVAVFGNQSGQIRALAFTGDSRYVVFGGWTCAIRIWDIATKSEVRTLRGHESQVLHLVSTPDGKRLVSAAYDGTIKVWDLTGDPGRLILASPDRSGHVIAGISPDGRHIAAHVFWSDRIWVYDVARGAQVGTLSKPGAQIMSASLNASGRLIVSGNSDGSLDIWDVETGAGLRTLHGHEGSVLSAAFTPDGKCVISGGMDQTIKVWNLESGRERITLMGHPDGVRSLACSPDGQHLVSGGTEGTLKLWDMATGAEVATLSGHGDGVISVAFSPQGQRIASASFDGLVKIWDAATGNEIQTLRGHNGLVQSVAYSPDGERIVSGGADHAVRLWDATTGVELLTIGGYESPIWSTMFTPDGKSVVVAGPGVTVLESAVPPGGDGLRKTAKAAEKLMKEVGEEIMATTSSRGVDPNISQKTLEKAEKASRMEPDNIGVLVTLGAIQNLLGQHEAAVKTFSKAHALEPNTSQITMMLSQAQYSAGRYAEAVKTVTEGLETSRRILGEDDASTLHILNQLAWMQATCPAAEARNGAEAVRNATRACELTGWNEPAHLDTLAAAYAEVGDFDSAVRWQKEAIRLLTEADLASWPAQFAERLRLYESGQPCREQPR
jgi:WD40 repeat protein/serine/threonine protein kinase